MDKYEYNLKLEQIKSFAAEERYEEAAQIADTINWNKIKNVNTLVKVGEVYEQVSRYEESRDILLNAYDHSPIGRTIIARLAKVAVKMKDFEAAQEYYDEFLDIAPNDNQKYIIKYEMEKAKGVNPVELIPLLEELKEQEYTEEWAFELADLYHKVGMKDKCVDTCDELVLWFGDGPYVEKALELKKKYQPLTKVQAEKFRTFRFLDDGAKKENSINSATDTKIVDITKKDVNSDINNITVNSNSEIDTFISVDAKENQESSENDTTKAEDNQKLPKDVESVAETALEAEAVAMPKVVLHTERFNTVNLQAEIAKGMKEIMGADKTAEETKDGMKEILEDWEKTKKAAEAAIYDAEVRKLSSIKLEQEESVDIMEQLKDVLPKVEVQASKPKISDEEYLKNNKETKTLFESVNSILEKKIERLNDENEKIEQEIQRASKENEELTANNFDLLSFVKRREEAENTVVKENEKIIRGFPEIETNPSILQAKIENAILDSDSSSFRTVKKAPIDIMGATKRIPEIKTLTDEERAIFSYFIPVKGMERQICIALTGIIDHFNNDTFGTTGNLIIEGNEGCGKTVLAINILKVLQKECGQFNGKIGKINADALNKKDIRTLLKKVSGGCLIIEKAGELERSTVRTLSIFLEQDTSGMFLILEDSARGVKKALSMDESFARKFTERIKVPVFSNEELVTFAKSYSNERGYEIDEMAVLALHNRICNIQKLDQVTTLEEVKGIIDEAIEKEANSGIRKAINIFTAKRYTDDDKIVLTEKDFE
ncbi:MAG: hypothetical protein IKJ01_03825 [Lachnospiraceae bacterium]|nr:hypothetical protein [Lachnospiraceae bacterium]